MASNWKGFGWFNSKAPKDLYLHQSLGWKCLFFHIFLWKFPVKLDKNMHCIWIETVDTFPWRFLFFLAHAQFLSSDWLISIDKAVLTVLLKVWLLTFDLWVPEVPEHIKDVGSGKRKMRCFFGSVFTLWNCFSCLHCRSCCSVCLCQASCHPAIVQARNQHILPLFYTQIWSYTPYSAPHFWTSYLLNILPRLSRGNRSLQLLPPLFVVCSLYSILKCEKL